jgi:hypothetical protein
MRDDSGSIRNLVIGLLLVAAPFAAAYVLTGRNSNSEVLLIIAAFCVGLALTFAAVSGLRLAGSAVLSRSGLDSRQITVIGLTLLTTLTPWSIAITLAHAPQVFGWANPLAWLLAVCLLVTVMRSTAAYHGVALVGAGVALVLWVAWIAWRLTTHDFTDQHFPFLPVDLVSTGWYAGAVGWVVAVDGFATRRTHDSGAVGRREAWPLAFVPGMGVARLGYVARGRAWLAAAIVLVAFVGVAAVPDSEFAHWAQFREMPPDRGRLDVILGVAALGVIWLLSLFDTWRSLRRQVSAGDWLHHIVARTRQQ